MTPRRLEAITAQAERSDCRALCALRRSLHVEHLQRPAARGDVSDTRGRGDARDVATGGQEPDRDITLTIPPKDIARAVAVIVAGLHDIEGGRNRTQAGGIGYIG